MQYRVWIHQEGVAPQLPSGPGGKPAFPGDHPGVKGTPAMSSVPEDIDGLTAAVDRIVQLMENDGLTDEADIVIVRGKATEGLRDRGAYRTALPTQGRYVLAALKDR